MGGKNEKNMPSTKTQRPWVLVRGATKGKAEGSGKIIRKEWQEESQG